MDHRDQLPIGAELVGEYLIESILGAGGFGITYQARDLGLDKLVAIKEYFPGEYAVRDSTMTVGARSGRHSDMFEWGRTRFLEEARTLSRFNHPNIVRVSRVFEALNTAYMVLTYEEGPSFSQWLEELKRQPTQEELDSIFSRLLDALDALHAAQFIHRDIAPDNIIIRPDGSPVLLDFGAARQAIAEETRTLTGIIKPGYSPPEQYATKASHQGAWTDIYAIGATLYRAIAGQRPTDGPDRQLGDALVPAAQAAKGKYRASFLEAIDWALDLRPTERPQTIAALQEALFSDLPVDAIRSRPTGRPDPSISAPPPPPRKSMGWWPAIAAGLIAVLSVGGYFAYLNFAGSSADRDPAATMRELERRQAALEREKAAERERLRIARAKAKAEADEQAWRRARDGDSLAALRRYLDEHPDGIYVTDAKQRIAMLEEKARKEKEEAARRAAERRRQDEIAWQRAFDIGNKEAFERYLKEWPNGRYADAARRRIATLRETAKRDAEERERQRKRDAQAWEKATAAGTIESLRTYLRDFPAGRFAGEATRRIAVLVEAKQKRELEERRKREARELAERKKREARELAERKKREAQELAERKRREAREARERDDKAWAIARKQNSIQAYRGYLEKFPSGRHSKEANDKVALLEKHQRERQAEEQRRREEKRYRAQGRVPVAVGRSGKSEKVQWLKPGSGRTESFKDCPQCPDMVVVPAGQFKLGSPSREAQRAPDEGPQLNVRIAKPFAVGKLEVTFAEWDACVADGGCNAYKPSDQEWGRGKHPVINVSWFDARAYTAWLSRKTKKPYRLLSEAEWEYVARARSSAAYWWGNTVKNGQANFDRTSARGSQQPGTPLRRTMPAMSFKPNAWGLYETHGNVWEWVADCWYEKYSAAFKAERLQGKPALGSDCKMRVMRGGAWNSPASSLRSANRARFVARNRYFNLGFRVARTLSR